MGEETPYKPFNGICLTDTFQLGEKEEQGNLLTPLLKKNSERVEREQKKRIQIIVGNPPYSVGQRSANDNAQNQEYKFLESRIANTYSKGTKATNKNSLYDSYIKAFRWASDRIDKKFGGIIAFVSNAGWLDGNAMDGMRKCLVDEYSDIYVFNLRGNCRTSGEQRRKECGNVFGLGSRTPIAITILVKKPTKTGNATIHYHDIGDYLTREQKLEIVSKFGSIYSDDMQWAEIKPNKKGAWINQGNEIFNHFIIMGNKKKDIKLDTYFYPVYSRGVGTSRDPWCYNDSKYKLIHNINYTINKFNDYVNVATEKISSKDISMSMALIDDLKKGKKKFFDIHSIRTAIYRPFNKRNLYFNNELNNDGFNQNFKYFPSDKYSNIVICVSGVGGTKDFSTIAVNCLPDVQLEFNGQCFPLYYYKKKSIISPTLFDSIRQDKYERHSGITDFILERGQENYGKKVVREDIFYYVYVLLHSPDYRLTFAADLKKSLPRLPLVDKPTDFWSFSKAGRDLATIHLDYENQPAPAEVVVEGAESCNFHVQKMAYPDKKDKSVIRYNESIVVKNIPLEAYEYVFNGRSAIEWIMERYQIKTDKASGITNNPNDWAKEHGKPRYILDLLLSVMTVSKKTINIVNSLPKIYFLHN